jgi:hypothetical protein
MGAWAKFYVLPTKIDRISRSTAFGQLDFKPTKNHEKKMAIPNPCPVWRVLTSFVRQMA